MADGEETTNQPTEDQRKESESHTHTDAKAMKYSLAKLTEHIQTSYSNEEPLAKLTAHTHTPDHTQLCGTYVKYNSDAFKKMPQLELCVNGHKLNFMVDSGAGYSVVRTSDLPTSPEMSGRFIFSQGASGATVKENFTKPLKCAAQFDKHQQHPIKFEHGFLLSPCCPINLLGRDLMIVLGLNLVSSSEGVTVTHNSSSPTFTMSQTTHEQMFAYQWQLPINASTDLLSTSHSLVTPFSDFMHTDSLHCTSHVTSTVDHVYESLFLPFSDDSLKVSNVFWSGSRSAAFVSLTDQQLALFHVLNSSPHIPLSKSHDDKWQDLGPFVRSCQAAVDWQPTTRPDVMYSPSLSAFDLKMSPTLCCPATRSFVVTENHLHSYAMLSSPSDISPLLSDLPETLWAKDKYDVGLIRNCDPVKITPKSDYRPCKQQYPLRQEAVEGIRPVFESFLQAGVIVPCPDSPVRTPLFPVKKIRDKGQPTEWRFVQDLKAVNDAVIFRSPIVPNPYTLLSQIPPNAVWFSVVDLSNAFFSVPVHKDSQYWFAFNFENKAYTFTRLCQGYCESPSLYNQALRNSLEPLILTPGSALLQYVDDLLIASPTQEQCETNTIALLRHLAREGHKVSLSKLQFVQQTVTFLGHVVTKDGKSLSDKRVEAIVNMPKPLTKKQLMSFIGTCSFCRTFIPDFALLEAPLGALYHGKSLSPHERVVWTPEADEAFVTLKKTLQQSPTLALPNPDKPFVQAVDERDRCMTSVLLQSHGDKFHPVAYFSAKLDPVAAGLPRCLRAVAACEKAVLASRDIVGYSDLTLLVPHAVSLILIEQKTSHLSAARWLRYHTVLLDMPNITVKRCSTLNPATLLPLPDDGEEHNCVAELQVQCSPRPDLFDEPLSNSDLILYVDGSASRDPVSGTNCVGFSVCSDSEVLVSSSLPHHLSAQAAELIALTEACKLATGKTLTVYTDSRYAFGVSHDFGALWQHRNFLTSSGKKIAHHGLITDLLSAILLPKTVAVCKCAAHTRATDVVSRGNAKADTAAKAAARLPPPLSNKQLAALTSDMSSSLSAVQSTATPPEISLWKKSGAIFRAGVWYGPDNKPCLPKHFFPHYAKLSHGKDHTSKMGMLSMITEHWFTKGFSTYAQKYCQACVICATHNVGRPVAVTSQAAHQPPTRPFEHLMMDFIELSPSEGKSHCLVMVDMWSKWVEAFPASKQTASVVTKALLRDIIPRWGIPSRISSDNGRHFVNEAVKQLGSHLGMDVRTHCAYHPASGGAVERENGTLKTKLAKCCEDTGLAWTKVLPLVLMYMRMRKRTRSNLSPYGILFATPPHIGVAPPSSPLPSTDLCDDNMLSYCANLTSSLSDIRRQVTSSLPHPATEPLHNLQPGDFVVVKDFRRKNWRSRRWQGPYQILLTTYTAVKVAERATWIHASHCKRVPSPSDQLTPSTESTHTDTLPPACVCVS
ncbi:uncharacterized protein LOC133956894 [Platichthys flesus]|uniref:uncharacterized protein LOC133956894 n=1 Tax=Platichthys flesus TaxID=8260 RepID=UPI002DBE569E|nr:uncharacterized protein LOC133956894 [Platichthys flesus]